MTRLFDIEKFCKSIYTKWNGTKPLLQSNLKQEHILVLPQYKYISYLKTMFMAVYDRCV